MAVESSSPRATSLRCRVDAIVNAANEALQLGAGVAGAIRRKGGPTIQEECDRIGALRRRRRGRDGRRATLPARWVIHAVGPVWHGGQEGEEILLASAVRSALERAEEIGAKSVALPAISTGVYGFPLERAAEISVAEARRFFARARARSSESSSASSTTARWPPSNRPSSGRSSLSSPAACRPLSRFSG